MADQLAPYWLSLHGSARQADADQALLGALGVAAFSYPHQIDNVTRMATDTACRFLLADEVGLGKTIQALMVLRALAAQRQTGLRVALVTPDDLNHQWNEEFLCRTHIGGGGVAIEPDEESPALSPKKGHIAVELFRPARLAAGAVRLNARFYDVLVVDEYPKLGQQMRDLVGAASRTIPHVLLLSATPALHDEGLRRAILEILEPDLARRADASGEGLLALLAAREDEAFSYIVGGAEEREDLETPPGQSRAFYAETHGAFRRVIRIRRADYPDALPQRLYRAIVVAPTDGDADRVEAARRYLGAAAGDNVNVRSEALLQTALASPQAMINRVSTLKRPTAKMASALRTLEAAARDLGDAKLDALIDHLRATFAAAPSARIVVVADDNRSVDDLAAAIEKLVEVRVAKKRRAYGGSDVEMDVHVAQLRDEVEPFESGEARVLVAADVAAEGHNFQFATELVFYVLPWDPRDVDQWIGRLDRLGGRGRPGKRIIRITPIVTRDSIEARILEVYEAADVFSGGRVFDEDAWTSLAQAIDTAAYGSSGDWPSLIAAATARRRDVEGWRRYSKFGAPNRAAEAKERYAALAGQRYALPMDETDPTRRSNWFMEREVGAKRLLTLADELRVLRLQKRTDEKTGQPYRTLWYPHRPEPGDVVVPELETDGPWRRVALLLKRTDLAAPPNSNVGDRRLHFFDHGDPVHDSVVDTLAALAWTSSTKNEHLVRVPEGHPAGVFKGERLLLLTAMLRPTTGHAFDASMLEDRPSAGDTQAEREAMQSAVRRAYEEHLADARWFTDLAQPDLFVLGARLGSLPEEIDPRAIIGVEDGVGVPEHISSRALSVSDSALAMKARDLLIERLRELVRTGVEHRGRQLAEALPLRRFKTRTEAREAIAAAKAVELAGRSRGSTLAFDRARRRANELAVLLAEVGADMRQAHLNAMLPALANPQVTPRVIVLKVH
jgi:ATP-dependent helicase HepA